MASLKETLHKCPWDLLAISALTVLVVCVMIVLHVHAEVFFGLSRYLPLFLCGAMASGGCTWAIPASLHVSWPPSAP